MSQQPYETLPIAGSAAIEKALADRRAELALYCDLFAETYGRRPSLETTLAHDKVYSDLTLMAAARAAS